MTANYLAELRRNEKLIKRGLKRAKRHQSDAKVVVGGGRCERLL